MRRATAILTHPSCLRHNAGAGHPERSARVSRALEALKSKGYGTRVEWIEECEMASMDSVRMVHSERALDELVRANETLQKNAAQQSVQLDPDTSMNRHSLEAALRSAGAAIQAVQLVGGNTVQNAFCCVRPPGHHAERDRAMGFCLINSVCVGARYAQQKLGLERVAIVDFDVHHGNGTQNICWDDPNLLFVSTHQSPFYPGTGLASECGASGDNIVNLPLPAGLESEAFRAIFKDTVIPVVERFKPDLLMISAGFDAALQDPLGGMCLTPQDFAFATEQLCNTSNRMCDGRLVSLLEGGYDLDALAECVVAHVDALVHSSSSCAPAKL